MAEKDSETEKLELSLFRRKKKPEPDPEPSTDPKPEAPADDTATLPVPPAASSASEPAAERPKPGRRKAPRRAASSQTPPAAPSTSPAPTPSTTQVAPDPVDVGDVDDAPEPASKRSRLDIPLPALAPPVAALVVGAVVGLAAVGLTFASLLGCELVTGTDACGGPGLLVLLVVVVLMILGGATALRQMDVPDAGGLSFLGVAMFVAVCLVVLLPSLLEPWMIVVAPVLCALTFALAHWIVSRFDEDTIEAEGPEPHDVR